MYKKVLYSLTILMLILGSTQVHASDIRSLNNTRNVDITNVDSSIPRSDILSQEIIYVGGVPLLFESYRYDGFIVAISSLLEPTQSGYRVVMHGDEITPPMPRIPIEIFMDNVTDISNQMMQSHTQGIAPLNLPSRRDISQSSGTATRPGSAPGSTIVMPGTRVRHWFDYHIVSTNDIFGGIVNRVLIGLGGMSAAALQVMPVEGITLTEDITVNSFSVSASFPASFGVGLGSNTRTRALAASNVISLSGIREGFDNTWILPTFGAALVTIETSAASSVRSGNDVSFGNFATARSVARFNGMGN